MKELETYHTPNGIIKKLNTFKGKKALIGDYSPISYYNTQMVLESLGFEIDIAKDIETIQTKLSQKNYDIIFSNNIYMSGTGEILLQKLKSIKDFHTPIIVHTVSDNTDNYFINLGFNGYLKKPIKQDETMNLLKKLFCKV